MGNEEGGIKTKESMGPDVKDLGRKAKARLEEERSKRHEIVRLAAEKSDPQQKSDHTTMKLPKSLLKKRTTAKSTRKRRHRSSDNGTTTEDVIDRWMPDTSHLPSFEEKDERSSLVMIHGLPIDCTPRHLLKFFSGLETQRTMVLLSHPSRVHELDAKIKTRKLEGVERSPLSFRVCAKFQSAPESHLATKRTGEPIQINEDLVCIAVTQVEKSLATFLLKSIAIDGEQGFTFRETLSKVEAAVPQDAVNILWSEAYRRLKLEGYVESQIDSLIDSLHGPLTSEDLLKLQNHRKELQERRNALCRELPFGFVCDPELLLDPVTRVIAEADEVLRDRVDDIGTAITSSYQIKHLLSMPRS